MTLKEYYLTADGPKHVTIFETDQKPVNDNVPLFKLAKAGSKYAKREIRKIFERPNQEVDIYLK